MPQREIITLLSWFFLAVFVGFESLRLGVGTWNAPGPGFLPMGAALVICVLTAVLFVKAKGKDLGKNLEPLFQRHKLKNVLYALGCLLGYPLLLGRLGFFFCTVLFVAFCMKKISGQQWGKTVLTSFMVAFVSYLIFAFWLDIQIPELRSVQKAFLWGSRLWR